LQVIEVGKRDISGDMQVRKPDPTKWEKPHDYGEGKHAGELQDDEEPQDGIDGGQADDDR
jgi:hypothetical protein